MNYDDSRITDPGGPSPRHKHGAVFDTYYNRMIVTWGQPFYQGYPDAYPKVLNLAYGQTPTWSVPWVFGPQYKSRYSIVWDTQFYKGRALIWGGTTTGTYPEEFDYSAHIWILANTDTPGQIAQDHEIDLTPPTARADHTAIYDPNCDRMIVFGGVKHVPGTPLGSEYTNETWQVGPLAVMQYASWGAVVNCPSESPSQPIDAVAPLPTLKLLQNVPNPFARGTRIDFSIPSEGAASLEILDVLGRQVRHFDETFYAAGQHSLFWDGRDENGVRSSPGVYLYRLKAGGQVLTRRLTYLGSTR